MGKIYIVGKDKYYELLGTNTKEYNAIRIPNAIRAALIDKKSSPLNPIYITGGWRYYLALEDGKVLVGDFSLSLFFIHKKYSVNSVLNDITKGGISVDLSPWKIIKLNDDIPYCMNEYRRDGLVTLSDARSRNSKAGVAYTSGEYLVRDTKWGEEHRIHIYHNEDFGFDWYEDYVMFPGKNNYPPGSSEALRIRDFYSRIFREKAKSSKRRNNGGQ